jgi:hypothetical protein
MAKLSKQEIKAHREACALLEKDDLSIDERIFVIENWNEGAEHINSASGAFFTAFEFARNFAVETYACRTIDLCAGIGALSFTTWLMNGCKGEFTCLEINPDYAAVGRKVFPEAQWIVGDVLSPSLIDIAKDEGKWDLAIANPPFGRVQGAAQAPRYRGADFELKVIDVAGLLAREGVFIVPPGSAPFAFSGEQGYRPIEQDKLAKFYDDTGIVLQPNCGIDTSLLPSFRGTNIKTEIVLADFESPEEAYIPKAARRYAEPMLAL